MLPALVYVSSRYAMHAQGSMSSVAASTFAPARPDLRCRDRVPHRQPRSRAAPPAAGPDKGFNVMEIAGSFVPQGLLVKGALCQLKQFTSKL